MIKKYILNLIILKKSCIFTVLLKIIDYLYNTSGFLPWLLLEGPSPTLKKKKENNYKL